jgi:tryptophanyl-tRNA synthetase
MLPGLMGNAKMSSSLPSTAIYLTDVPGLVEKKIQYVDTKGVPDSCPIFLYRYLLLEESDEEVNMIYESCKSKCIGCEECKRGLVKKVNRFLAGHQRRRELIKGSVAKMLE